MENKNKKMHPDNTPLQSDKLTFKEEEPLLYH